MICLGIFKCTKCLCLSCSGQTDTIKHAAYLAHLGNNPARILKAVVDLLKQRYLAKEYTPLGIEDILLAISLKELMTDTRLWLESVSQTAIVLCTRVHMLGMLQETLQMLSAGWHILGKPDG